MIGSQTKVSSKNFLLTLPLKEWFTLKKKNFCW